MKWQHLIDKLEGAYADKTIAGYRADFADFAAWARRKRLAALPAEPATLARYVDEIGESLKPSSVRRKLAAIRKVHRLAGFENVAAAEEVVLALRRVRRSKPGRPEQALGVTIERRDRLVGACADDLAGLRDRVLVLVGFETLCRRSELVALRVQDITRNANGTMSLLVRRAKNDPDGLGRTAHLSPATSATLEEWLRAAELDIGPLLRPVYKNRVGRRSLNPATVGRILKQLAKAAGLGADEVRKVSGHSLRVGAAQSLTARGVGILPIMSAGGWRSMNVVARYVENVETNLWV